MYKIWGHLLQGLVTMVMLGLLLVTVAILYLDTGLPNVSEIKNIPLHQPLRILSADDKLIAEFGNQRRNPITYEEIPQHFIQAIISTEDKHFFEHHGVDIMGLGRAVLSLIKTGKKSQGGSTITMQLARNYFLTPERTYIRKIKEILLAIKLERMLSKEEILTLYSNKIYLGHRAYGIAAASQVYYGKKVNELNLAQIAMLAGLPKAPSSINPLANAHAAKKRRNYVLRRMWEEGFIEEAAYKKAVKMPLTAKYHGTQVEVEAPYFAEMVRQAVVEQFGEHAYQQGLVITTTLLSTAQLSAKNSLEEQLLSYDRRHGYRGPVGHFSVADISEALIKLNDLPRPHPLVPALVLKANASEAEVLLAKGTKTKIHLGDVRWARAYINEDSQGKTPSSVESVIPVGSLIYLRPKDKGFELAQIPDINGAFVALSPQTGGIQALVGGYDYSLSKYNRVTQAKRQPGSNFKPFVYSAALEDGMTAATLINDAPVVYEDRNLDTVWRPENFSGQFYGPTRLRTALIQSRNLVSIRILKRLGLQKVISHAKRFGFEDDALPRNLSLALGSGVVSPLQLASAYAVFANGGYKKTPFYIQKIVDSQDNLLFNYIEPEQAERVIDEGVAFVMNSMLRDVIQQGTATRARVLKREDLAGKTGTTNDQTDAWFTGYHPEMVASVWIGFDSPRPLGHFEVGGRAALPAWIDFMKPLLPNLSVIKAEPPAGIMSVRIDPKTGLLASFDNPDAIYEYFQVENVPDQTETASFQYWGDEKIEDRDSSSFEEESEFTDSEQEEENSTQAYRPQNYERLDTDDGLF